MPISQNRRRFLTGLTAASAASLVGAPARSLAEPPPETTRMRLAKIPSICVAPQYVAEELAARRGFCRGRLCRTGPGAATAAAMAKWRDRLSPQLRDTFDRRLGCRRADHSARRRPSRLLRAVRKRAIDSIVDLKGKSVGVQALGSGPHLFLASIAAYVGLDPARDINWVVNPAIKPKELFARGNIDAFLGFPPEPQELRASKVGHVIVNSAVDRPWSQYYCCMLAGNNDFVAAHPVATKRVLRAILKAADLCATEPQRVAQQIVDDGFTERYDYALQTLNDVPYNKWREYDPEDTIRFYALRLHEAGMIKSNPQKIIAEGTDWRFLNELKRELKT